MRTLAALLFIAGAAAVAVWLARMPTVVDGRVMAADRLEEVRKDGAVNMECDPEIPISRLGAVFTCVATLADGATQVVEYTLRPEGRYELKPRPPTQVPRNRSGHSPNGSTGAAENPSGHSPNGSTGAAENPAPPDPPSDRP